MERYGEKPKKFTSAWFGYVWEYYKVQIILVIIAIAAVVYTWIAIKSEPHYDLYVCIAGDKLISDEAKENLKEELKNNISDTDGDGEITIQILDYSVPDNYDDSEYSNAMKTKIDLELQAGDSFIFIVSESQAKEIEENPAVEGLFAEPSDLDGKESDNKYFAKAENSSVLKNAGIPYNDLYVGVRNFTHSEGDEEDTAQRNNALNAAKSILGN